MLVYGFHNSFVSKFHTSLSLLLLSLCSGAPVYVLVPVLVGDISWSLCSALSLWCVCRTAVLCIGNLLRVVPVFNLSRCARTRNFFALVVLVLVLLVINLVRVLVVVWTAALGAPRRDYYRYSSNCLL